MIVPLLVWADYTILCGNDGHFKRCINVEFMLDMSKIYHRKNKFTLYQKRKQKKKEQNSN